jgi:hypothetical protein
VADHEGELEQVRATGLGKLVVSGFAHDRTSKTSVQVAVLVNNKVRATVTADLPRPNGKQDGFSATIAAPGQPANVCARTVLGRQPRAGLVLGCRQPPFAVPIAVVGDSGTPVSGQAASFFWVDARGDIAKDLQTVPIQNGVARYTDRPIPRQLQWAITVHDPTGRPIFRSGPLAELPGPASAIVAGTTISAFRSSIDASTGLNSDDAGIGLLRRRLAQLPPPLRFESVEVRGDGAGHELVVVHARAALGIATVRFTYRLPVAVRPQSAPGRPNQVVAVSPEGLGAFSAPSLLRFREALDRAILDGVQEALDGGLKLIASIELSLHDIPFAAALVSVTSVEIRGATQSPTLVARVHAGTVSGPPGAVVTES